MKLWPAPPSPQAPSEIGKQRPHGGVSTGSVRPRPYCSLAVQDPKIIHVHK